MTHPYLRSLMVMLICFGLAAASANPQSPSPGQKKAQYQQHLEATQKWKSIIENYVAATPAVQTELAALADSLPKPQSAFEYVRDQIALEPYPGAMKGAAATLVTHGGNDLDRALLLATLLSMQGIDVQIAHGRLTPAQAQSLLQQITMKPDAAELIAQMLPAAGAGPSPTKQKIQALAAADAQRLADGIEESYSLLDSSVKAAKITLGIDKSAAQLKSLQDHYWVRAVVDGKTLDLDASFAAAEYGRRYADVAETLDFRGLNGEQMQIMRLRLVAEYLQGGVIASQNLLEGEFNTLDLWGQNIRVAILPNEAKAAPNDFHASLSIGGDTAAEKTFQLRVNAAGKANVTHGNNGPFSGLAGALGGGGTDAQNPNPGDAPSGSVLARLYLEVETRGPQLAPSHSRRVILDRLASSGGTLRIDPAMAGDDVAAALITQVWDGAIGVGAIHPLYLAKATLAWIASDIDLQNLLMAAADPGEKLDPSQLPGPLLAPELLSFFLSSGNVENRIQKQFTPQVRAYYERPRLAFLRHGFVVGDWADLSKRASYREGIDIVNSPFGFVGHPELQTGLAMRWGAADTALELRFSLNAADAFNTLSVIAAAAAAKVPVHTIGPDQRAALASMSIPASIKAVMEGDLRDRRAILAPEQLVDMNGTHTYGWWSIEQDTGYAIGKMELGGAQALTEYTNLQRAIPKASFIAGNLMGNVLRCYMGAVSDVLASGAGGSTAGCLQGACCQAISQLLKMEVQDSMSIALLMEDEEELSMVYKLLDAAMAQGANYTGGKAAAAAGKAACDAGG